MVGLQANSLQANRESRLQSSAVSLARELAEMARGNPVAATRPVGNVPPNSYLVSTASVGGSRLVATTASYCLAVGSSCADETAIGNAEMTEWLARVGQALPGARVVVCFDATPYTTSNGLPEWACDATNAGGTLVVKIGWTRASLNRTPASANGVVAATGPDRASLPGVILSLTPDPALSTPGL